MVVKSLELTVGLWMVSKVSDVVVTAVVVEVTIVVVVVTAFVVSGVINDDLVESFAWSSKHS